MSEKDEKWVMDEKVKEDAEKALRDSDIIGELMGPAGSEERIPLVEGWIPDSEAWQGKTIVSKRQAIAHALSKNLALAFPEVRPMDPFIQTSINDLEMLLTSVDGKSREQHMEVLRAMFGGGPTENDEARSLAYTAIAGAYDKDD